MPPMRHGSHYVAKNKSYPDTPYDRTKKKKKKKKEKQMKAVFKNLCISLAGSFISPADSKHPNDTTRTPHEKIVGWITAHRGTFHKKVEANTTHLVCSIEEYKSNSSQVQKAKALGNACKIVVLDWIVDSLLGLPHEKYVKKLKPAGNYLVTDAIKRIKKATEVKEKSNKEFEEGVQASKELADTKLHHIYFDTDGFQYKVELTRVSVSGLVKTEKYTLYLFESHAKPSTYMFGAKYTRTRQPAAYLRQHIRPMIFSSAFAEFKKFFKEKTGGIDWDDRLEHLIMADSVFTVGGTEVEHRVFRYTPPKLGQATGMVPHGYVRPEWRAQAKRQWKRDQKELQKELFGEEDGEEEDEDEDDGEDGEKKKVCIDLTGGEGSTQSSTLKGDEQTVHSSDLEANVADYGVELVAIGSSYC